MSSKRKKDIQEVIQEAPIVDAEISSPVGDLQNELGFVDDPVLSDSATEILQNELAARKDDHLRLAADFDNYKKRTRRDSERQAAAEKESFIQDLLPIVDNLERALASESSISLERLHEGVTMTLKQLDQLLHRHGIEAVEDVGQLFDPHRHEAVSVRHDPNQPDHIVLEVTQRGYCRGDKVFRPAKVIVNDLSYSSGVAHGS